MTGNYLQWNLASPSLLSVYGLLIAGHGLEGVSSFNILEREVWVLQVYGDLTDTHWDQKMVFVASAQS